MAGHVACMEEWRNAYSVLVEKPEGKRLRGTPKRRLEDNIRFYLKKECKVMGRINLKQDRGQWRAVVNAVMNLRVP